MAGAEMTSGREQRICAIRLPGASRACFADAGEVDLALGDWVAVWTAAGEEGGRIVVAPDQWLSPVRRDDAVPILRVLSGEELTRLAGHVERARELIDPAASVLRGHVPDAYLSGLRHTLDGSRAVVSVIGPLPEDTDDLASALTDRLDLPVSLEQEHAGRPEQALVSGGTGQVPGDRPETFRELLERRFDVLREPESFAPQGLPRLGSTVQTDRGTGRLVAVDIRHWQATVALDGGDEEITVSVDELEQSG